MKSILLLLSLALIFSCGISDDNGINQPKDTTIGTNLESLWSTKLPDEIDGIFKPKFIGDDILIIGGLIDNFEVSDKLIIMDKHTGHILTEWGLEGPSFNQSSLIHCHNDRVYFASGTDILMFDANTLFGEKLATLDGFGTMRKLYGYKQHLFYKTMYDNFSIEKLHWINTEDNSHQVIFEEGIQFDLQTAVPDITWVIGEERDGNDIIYFASNPTNTIDQLGTTMTIHCYDLTTNTMLFEVPFEPSFSTRSKLEGFFYEQSIIIHRGREVISMNRITGEILWRTMLISPFTDFRLENDLILINSSSPSLNLNMLDPSTGEILDTELFYHSNLIEHSGSEPTLVNPPILNLDAEPYFNQIFVTTDQGVNSFSIRDTINKKLLDFDWIMEAPYQEQFPDQHFHNEFIVDQTTGKLYAFDGRNIYCYKIME